MQHLRTLQPDSPRSAWQCTLIKGTDRVANAFIQTRVDDTVKEEAAAVLTAIGLTRSDAIRLMLMRATHDKALPFETLIPNAMTIAAMKEARTGKGVAFTSVEALMVDLIAEVGAVLAVQARFQARSKRAAPWRY
jgi:DNA-damage-inducible protein J